MAKQMDAETIARAVRQLEENTRHELVRDIVATLSEGWDRGDDPDTWAAGFAAAVEVIRSNY